MGSDIVGGPRKVLREGSGSPLPAGFIQPHCHSTMPLKKTTPTPFDENGPTITLPPPAERCHQRSRTTTELPPLFTRQSSSSPTRLSAFLPSMKSASRNASPERVSPDEAAEYEVSEEAVQRPKTHGGVAKGIASWFEGTSEPVNIGLLPSPKKEKDDPILSAGVQDTMFSNSSEAVDTLTQRSSRPQSRAASTNRFSFFRKQSATTTPTITPAQMDELAQLDIRESLFPHGPSDEFSPAAFKNLQLNAEGTLRKFQYAHQEQQKQIKSLTSTRNAQADDLEASQFRGEHLKMQLVEMAERASEQERLITALRNELAAISHPHSQASYELQQSSVRKVDPNTEMSTAYQTARSKRNRVSDVSSAGSTHSDQYSIFSAEQRSLNNFVDSPGTSVAASPVMKHASMHITTVSQAVPQQEHAAVSVIPVAECQKCHGVKAEEAWDVISMLKVESHALKDRIEELEGANGQALDLLGCLDGLRLDDLGLK